MAWGIMVIIMGCGRNDTLENQTTWSGALDIAASVTDLQISGNVYVQIVPGSSGTVAVNALDTARYRLLTALDSTATHLALRIDEPQQYAGSEPQPPCTLTVALDTAGALQHWHLDHGATVAWNGNWKLPLLTASLDNRAHLQLGTLKAGFLSLQAQKESRIDWQELTADSVDIVAQDRSQALGYRGRITYLKALASHESDVIVNQVVATQVRVAAQQASDVSVQVEDYADMQAHTNSEVRYTTRNDNLVVKERTSTGGNVKRLKGATGTQD